MNFKQITAVIANTPGAFMGFLYSLRARHIASLRRAL
jgi:hypothetical protein